MQQQRYDLIMLGIIFTWVNLKLALRLIPCPVDRDDIIPLKKRQNIGNYKI